MFFLSLGILLTGTFCSGEFEEPLMITMVLPFFVDGYRWWLNNRYKQTGTIDHPKKGLIKKDIGNHQPYVMSATTSHFLAPRSATRKRNRPQPTLPCD